MANQGDNQTRPEPEMDAELETTLRHLLEVYKASRGAACTAEQHERLRNSAFQVEQMLRMLFKKTEPEKESVQDAPEHEEQ